MIVRRLWLAVAATGMVLAPAVLLAQGTQPPAKEPQWKDRAEYDLVDAITKDNNPQTKLEKLNEWKEKYPSTDFESLRQRTFLMTYASAGKVTDALNTAKTMLAANPNDFYALYYTAFETPMIAGTGSKATEDQLSTAEKAANAILNNPTKPADVTDADWTQVKSSAQLISQKTLGWVALQRGQDDAAEAAFKKVLATSPNDGETSYWLGISIIDQKKPERYSEAFYDYARAAAYDGPGALAPNGRAAVKTQLQKFYTLYHGNGDGLDQLLAQAKNSPTPPADFKIVSKAEIANQQEAQHEQWVKDHPELALWMDVKTKLTGADGAAYFESSMKDALLPELTGKVISMEPATRPKKIVVGIENGATADATLVFDVALPGKVEPGTELKFKGQPQSFTASPFMIVFKVDKSNLVGWTGTNPKAPARPVRRRAAQ